jgi:hypothetical protein
MPRLPNDTEYPVFDTAPWAFACSVDVRISVALGIAAFDPDIPYIAEDSLGRV